MNGTAIEWTDLVWNPTTGCDRVSPGCDNCYALTMARRLKAMHNPKYQRDGDPRTSGPGFKLTVHPRTVNEPLRWQSPRKVFVNSMSDLFHADVPSSWLVDIFAVMAAARRHTFQVLTKRHARMRSILNDPLFVEAVRGDSRGKGLHPSEWVWPLPNLWIGVSAEDQQRADLRIPALLETPAAVRWVSAEPLLGPIDFDYLGGISGLSPDWVGGPGGGTGCPHPLLDWVVVGGESGPNARPMHPEWVRGVRDQCASAGVPFLFKQWGVHVTEGQAPDDITLPGTSHRLLGMSGPSFYKVGKHAAGRLLDDVLHDEYPQTVAP